MSRGPVITQKTTLSELQKLGATTLSDIPTTELLEFIRNTCIQVSSDTILDQEDEKLCESFAKAACHIQAAIDSLNEYFEG